MENTGITEIKTAADALRNLSREKDMQASALLREIELHDEASLRAEGFSAGLEQGIEQGIEQRNIEIAKNLLNQKIDINIISKTTGLSIDKINELK